VIELRPPDSLRISNVVLISPDGIRTSLTVGADGVSGAARLFSTPDDLEAAVPPGMWSARYEATLNQGDSFVGFFRFTLESALVPVPRITNAATADAIDPALPFRVAWSPWTNAVPGDRIQLQVVDTSDRTVFSAATDCAADAVIQLGEGSVEIPAGRLAAGSTYTTYLSFARSTLLSTNRAAAQIERGWDVRTTALTLRTTGQNTQPASLAEVRISSGNLIFVMSGTPGAAYQVEWSTNLVTWTLDRRLVMPASRRAIVIVPVVQDGAPRFYRAHSISGLSPRLTIERTPTGQLLLSILGGDPNGRYQLQYTDRTWGGWTNAGLTVPTDIAGNRLVILPQNFPFRPPGAGGPVREWFLRALRQP
jgi:hypothetical protein